jgi:hypothetical protein
MMRCPHCSSRDLRRSRTRWWERPFRYLSPLVPYRCWNCHWRGWRREIAGIDEMDEILSAAPELDRPNQEGAATIHHATDKAS